nr:hypothetical protein [Tanacetum cinerariifolium]
MSYEKIRPIFEMEYNKVHAYLNKGPEIDAERIKAPRKKKVEKDQPAKKQKGDELKHDNAKKQKLEEQEEAKELKKNLEIICDDEDDKIVKDRFKKSQPKEVLDVFIWHTLKVMFEHTIEDNMWKHRKGPQGLARVKNWKLFDFCGVYCVTLETIQLFLLAKKIKKTAKGRICILMMCLNDPHSVVATAENVKAKPKAKWVTMQEPSEFKTTLPSQSSLPSWAKDKDKGLMVEPEMPLTRKGQIVLDEEVTRRVKSPTSKETVVDKEESSKQGRKIANIDVDAKAYEAGESDLGLGDVVGSGERSGKWEKVGFLSWREILCVAQ